LLGLQRERTRRKEPSKHQDRRGQKEFSGKTAWNEEKKKREKGEGGKGEAILNYSVVSKGRAGRVTKRRSRLPLAFRGKGGRRWMKVRRDTARNWKGN